MNTKTHHSQKEDIEKIKKERDEYKNSYLRALADYRNLEKRMIDERTELIKRADASLILKLLPFLDHLQKAEAFVKDDGLKIVKDDFVKILKELGLEEINVVGKEFDPHQAEAVDLVEGDKDNIVVEVLRKGYMFEGKILRIAQVKVSRKITK
jgi:molecular chaperone GrpE